MIDSVIFYTECEDGGGGGYGGSSRILSFYTQQANTTICSHCKAYRKHLAT